MKKDDMKSLLVSIKEENKEEICEIVSNQLKKTYNLAKNILNSEDMAKNAVYKSYEEIYQNIENTNKSKNLKLEMFVFGTLIKVSKNLLENLGEESKQREIEELDESNLPVARMLSKEKLQEEIRNTIADLSDDRIIILVLKDIFSMTYKDISTLLDLREGTVKSSLHRSRKIFAEQMMVKGIYPSLYKANIVNENEKNKKEESLFDAPETEKIDIKKEHSLMGWLLSTIEFYEIPEELKKEIDYLENKFKNPKEENNETEQEDEKLENIKENQRLAEESYSSIPKEKNIESIETTLRAKENQLISEQEKKIKNRMKRNRKIEFQQIQFAKKLSYPLIVLSIIIIALIIGKLFEFDKEETKESISEKSIVMQKASGFSNKTESLKESSDKTKEASSKNGDLNKRKLAYFANIELKTVNFEKELNAIKKRVSEFGGYISKEDIRYNSRQKRGNSNINFASLSLKIPVKKYREFLDEVSESNQVMSKSESVEDLSSRYFDVEQNALNLEAREKSLRAIMEKAKGVSEIIEVEKELSRVREEIETLRGKLKTWDKLVDMASIELILIPYENTEIKNIDKGFLSKLNRAFLGTINNMFKFLQNIVVLIFAIMPVILIALLLFVIYHFFISKEKREKKEEKTKTKNMAENEKKEISDTHKKFKFKENDFLKKLSEKVKKIFEKTKKDKSKENSTVMAERIQKDIDKNNSLNDIDADIPQKSLNEFSFSEYPEKEENKEEETELKQEEKSNIEEDKEVKESKEKK